MHKNCPKTNPGEKKLLFIRLKFKSSILETFEFNHVILYFHYVTFIPTYLDNASDIIVINILKFLDLCYFHSAGVKQVAARGPFHKT